MPKTTNPISNERRAFNARTNGMKGGRPTKPTASDLGRFIRKLRVAHGMTQTDVAMHMGVNRKLLIRWEHGYCRPSQRKLIGFVNALSLTGDERAALQGALQWSSFLALARKRTGTRPGEGEFHPSLFI